MSNKNPDMSAEAHAHNIIIDKREIFVHGSYSQEDCDPGVDWRMANTLVKNIRILENISLDDIYIHQMSIGGDEEAGYSDMTFALLYSVIHHISSFFISAYAHLMNINII